MRIRSAARAREQALRLSSQQISDEWTSSLKAIGLASFITCARLPTLWCLNSVSISAVLNYHYVTLIYAWPHVRNHNTDKHAAICIAGFHWRVSANAWMNQAQCTLYLLSRHALSNEIGKIGQRLFLTENARKICIGFCCLSQRNNSQTRIRASDSTLAEALVGIWRTNTLSAHIFSLTEYAKNCQSYTP